ncbi:MAG: hypothetical protein E7320_09035 [Clostridiales bacterium]|nr:hypothetical protein [Clostridiales bacterium]
MTVTSWIDQELGRILVDNKELFDCLNPLNDSVKKIIEQLTSHLENIRHQMPDYDDHGPGHSKKVLENIEKLLQIRGVESLTLLEAIMLRLCCYLHDAGMCLPDYFLRFLEQIEEEDYAFHHDKPETSMQAMLRKSGSGLRPYTDVKDQFFCPESEDEYIEFYAKELVDYEKYRMGLAPVSETEDRETFIRETRQDHLRRTHGERSNRYAQNLKRMLAGISKIDKEHIVPALGNICAAHCWNIDDTFKLPSGLRVLKQFTDATETTCNVRYLAMLLRLGDVLHVSNDRTSRTRYAASDPMNTVTDLHWRIKLPGLMYTITNENEQLKISYIHDGIENPDEYYFLHDYLNWADDELSYYANFLTDANDERYRLGLPRHVDRSGINPIGFTPDRDLRFRLEQRKIIELLMGARLYRNEWMCLRELYQNALDACRCMRAEDARNGRTSNPCIEFGLSKEEGRKVLYCRDEGTGMTEYIVKNYLLRIGNSYYHSDDFRRSNAAWKDAVAPISEFGIGLLSCYMIADEIEVITRHYTLGEDKTIRLRMKGSEDYGYFCDATTVQQEQLGDHGTIVKLYLKDKFAAAVTDRLPDDPEVEVWISKNASAIMRIQQGTERFEEQYTKPLYHRIQRFVCIPDPGIPVVIMGATGENRTLVNMVDLQLDTALAERIMQKEEAIDWPIDNSSFYWVFKTNYLSATTRYLCSAKDEESNTTAYISLVLPEAGNIDNLWEQSSRWRRHRSCYINGIFTKYSGFQYDHLFGNDVFSYNFAGKNRPLLTVDRGEIRALPETALEGMRNARALMPQRIAECIQQHYAASIPQLPKRFLEHLIEFMQRFLSAHSMYDVLQCMAEGDFQELRLYGIPLKQWFGTRECRLPMDRTLEYDAGILNLLCRDAARVDLLEKEAVITFPAERRNLHTYVWLHKTPVLVDVWNNDDAQYDFVTDLYPFARKRDILSLLLEEGVTDWVGLYERIYKTSPVRFGGVIDTMSLQAVLEALSGKQNAHLSYRSGNDNIRNGDKQYLIYAFMSPRPLTEWDRAFIKNYEHIPQYMQGIKEGWSILYYGCDNGYVIAPGKKDRMEMLKLIPKEVLELNNDIEFCFMDGTHAFGTKRKS